MSTPHRVLLFDTETAPLLSYLWQLKTDYVNADMVIRESFMLTWSAKWEDDDKVHHGRLTRKEAVGQDDSRIVGKLADLLRQADVLVAHNITGFDVPKVNGRLLVNDLPPLGPLRTIDTLTLARKTFKVASNRLDYLGQLLGIGQKQPTGLDLWKRCYRGEPAALRQMDEYCQHDVVGLLEPIYQRIKPYVKLPRLVDAESADEWGCTRCGSTDVIRRGHHRTNASTFQRWSCKACGHWFRERKADKTVKMAGVPL